MDQGIVAGLMADFVIDAFEVVEIEDQQGGLAPFLRPYRRQFVLAGIALLAPSPGARADGSGVMPAAGLPVVASRWRYYGEMLQDGVTGLSYDFDRPELWRHHHDPQAFEWVCGRVQAHGYGLPLLRWRSSPSTWRLMAAWRGWPTWLAG